MKHEAAAVRSLTVQDARSVVEFDDERLTLLRKTLANGLTEIEFELFVSTCRHRRLDPFALQLYAIKRGGRMTLQMGIDGLRLIAARSGEYEGQVGPQWCSDDGIWMDAWFEDKPPAAARVGVYRAGFREATWGVAAYKTFVQEFNGKASETWAKMPDVMLAKCAEAQALRKAFPQDIGDIYVEDEAAAIDYVNVAQGQREGEYVAPKAIKAPKRKSEKDKDVAVTGDGEIVDPVLQAAAQAVVINPEPPSSNPPTRMPEEVTNIAANSDAAFGAFWNSLPETLERLGKSLGDVAMVLNVEPSAIGLKKWFKACKGDPMTVIEEALARA